MLQTAERAASAKRRPPHKTVQLGSERSEYNPISRPLARLSLRSIINDDGHFLGLEVAR